MPRRKGVYDWLVKKGFTFHFGQDAKTELTLDQVLDQCRMYVAAARIVETFGCEAIGIQYQQGMKDLMPASDLVEGMLNNDDRPPVKTVDGKPIREGQAIVHFNEVDECAGLDALFTNRVHRALGQPAETTLHDIRWGDPDRSGTTKDYVWVLEISGAAPPAHHIGGWAGSDSLRQPPMYFPFGGGTVRGIAKPGEIVWSRVFVEAGKLKMDLGRAHVVELPKEETERRWNATTPQWPIMHAVLHGVIARPDDGAAQGQPHPGRLRQFRRRKRIWRWPPRRRSPRSWAWKCRSAGRSGTGRRCFIDARP